MKAMFSYISRQRNSGEKTERSRHDGSHEVFSQKQPADVKDKLQVFSFLFGAIAPPGEQLLQLHHFYRLFDPPPSLP